MRVHFTYETVERPWGGANNFIRALKTQIAAREGLELTETIEQPCDLMFMNQLGRGPAAKGHRLTLDAVRRARARDGRRLVVRAVNLDRHAFRWGPRNLVMGYFRDRALLKLLAMAERVVFQSTYQRDVFRRAGYRGWNDVVIHNGADPVFWTERPPELPGTGPLRLVSATASDRSSKRHDLIAAVSRLSDVEVLHCGAWPEGLDPANVRLLGKLDRSELAVLYGQAHLLLHPAVKDPCPNAVFEAICAGLPVLYNPGPGSSAEIVGGNGLAIDQDDLAASLAKARKEAARLQERVQATRRYYHVDRATSDYLQVFRDLVEGPSAQIEDSHDRRA